MKKFIHVHIFLSLLSLTSTAAIKYAKDGCTEMCGTVKIPYPFGIGANCSINKWYTVDCNSSTPYLSALNHLEVLGVDLDNQLVTINAPIISDCNQTNSLDLSTSPFVFSKLQNIFVFEGCGNAVMMEHGTSLIGCSTTCRNGASDENDCLGITCCQTTLPHHLKSYSMNLTGVERVGGDRACGSALLVNKESYLNERRNSHKSIVEDNSYLPVSLLWTLSGDDKLNCCISRPFKVEVDLVNATLVDSWKCAISVMELGLVGNPYIIDGCRMPNMKEYFNCTYNGGSYTYEPIFGTAGLVTKYNFSCIYPAVPSYINPPESKSKSISLGVILGVSISMGALFLVVTSYVLYKVIKKTKESRQRKRFFKRNGGLLLKQQEEADPSLVDKTILFSSRELEKATNNFNDNRILGRGGQGTVYKGMLVDGRIVAIKKSKVVDENQLEQFINEVVILSQVSHRNGVKLLGCCLETDVPLLVSEFIPNGTLYDHLHNETNEFPVPLKMRLQIATEVAGALAYLHTSTSIPIYHRDIKTTNILLDDKYKAKVSDFGASRLVSIDQTHLTTLVQGTLGYLDPEYFQSSQLTEKSDVYSFGVVLVELLTGEMPISHTRFGGNKSLATHFLLAMKEGYVMSVFDVTLIKEGTRDDLLALASLATRCLNMNGKNRPTMKEVAIELETIGTSYMPLKNQSNTGPMIYGEDLKLLTYDES